jgi:CRISPR type I-E-associated protein CasB/Cse2
VTFNLLSRPFLKARLVTGEERSFGVLGLLKNAHLIRHLSPFSPLDEFAIHRFLLVVLHEASPGEVLDQRAIGPELVAAISRKTILFDLFDKERPFFQDGKARDQEERPASDLFAELPSDTAINHYRHVYDSGVALCPSCCAVGLLRLPTFCTQGGQGKAPSVNAAPPVYAMPIGTTLLETLAINLPAFSVMHGDRPCWSGQSESKQLGPLEGLTWQARRALLLPTPGEGRCCSRCGGQEDGPDPRIVRQVIFAKGRTLREVAGRDWRDPHAAHLDGGVIRPPESVADPLAAAAQLLKIARSLLCSLVPMEDGSGVDAVRRAAASLEGAPLFVSSISFATRQAKALDDFVTTWQLSGALNAVTATRLLSELDWYEDTVWDFQKQAWNRLRAERPATNGKSSAAPSRSSLQYCHHNAAREFRRLLANPNDIDLWRASVRQSIFDGFKDWLVPVAQPLKVADRDEQFKLEIARLHEWASDQQQNTNPRTELPNERQFIQRLYRLRQDACDRLKRLGNQPLEDNGRTFDLYADLWWPQRGHLRNRLAVMTVAALFPWLPSRSGWHDFGLAVRILGRKRDKNVERVHRQFEAVLAAPLVILRATLLPLIRDMARLQISLDWACVLRDLKKWNHREQPIQRQWAHSFYTGTYYADRDSSTSESLAVESES